MLAVTGPSTYRRVTGTRCDYICELVFLYYFLLLKYLKSLTGLDFGMTLLT